jgi:putative peptide zinc metalloprotease protein
VQIDPQPNLQLPALRPDLEFFPGPADTDGSPTWNIRDPQSGVYHKIDWAAAMVLQRLKTSRALSELQQEIHAETTLLLSPEDILKFCKQAEDADLTVTSTIRNAEKLVEKWKAAKMNPFMWLLTHYLYIRVPLIKPDGFLTQTLPHIKWLASKAAIKVYLLLSAVGLFSVSQRFEEYTGTFTWFFNFRGMIYYGTTIIALKIIHEFAHAYTAKNLGVRVPVMGVAFIVFWPLAFCDVTDGWKLGKRTDRLWISAAGICAELTLAGISLFLWSISAPGIMHSIFFILSSATIASTLLVNLNPAMRFDGYYILGDLWGIDNLQHRAFAATKWFLRKALLNLKADCPEKNLTDSRLAGMVIYSIYAWLYRLGLYIGIAIIVYYKFTKLIGIILFLTEIGWFIARPAILEFHYLWKIRDEIKSNNRAIVTCGTTAAVFLYLLLPLPRSVELPAFVVAEKSQTIYVPERGIVKRIAVKRNQHLAQGQVLMEIESERLHSEIKITEIEIELLKNTLHKLIALPEGSKQLAEKTEELSQAQSRLTTLQKKNELNTVISNVTAPAVLYQWNTEIRPGTPLKKGVILGRIANLSNNRVAAYVKEEYADSFKVDTEIDYVSSSSPERFSGRVISANPIREESLEAASLSSLYMGDIPTVRDKYGRLRLLEPCYRIVIRIDENGEKLRIGQTGRIWGYSSARSQIFSLIRHLYVVLLKESGF